MGYYSKRHWQQFQALTPEQEANRLRSLRCQEQARAEAEVACPLPPVDPANPAAHIDAVRARTEWIAQRERQLWGAA